MHAKANKKHILTKKSSKRIRQLGQDAQASPGDVKNLRKMLPYDL